MLRNYLTLKGSFSAVSKPNFASKYALESSRRDLQNALLCTVLVGSAWVKKYTKINIEFSKLNFCAIYHIHHATSKSRAENLSDDVAEVSGEKPEGFSPEPSGEKTGFFFYSSFGRWSANLAEISPELVSC